MRNNPVGKKVKPPKVNIRVNTFLHNSVNVFTLCLLSKFNVRCERRSLLFVTLQPCLTAASALISHQWSLAIVIFVIITDLITVIICPLFCLFLVSSHIFVFFPLFLFFCLVTYGKLASGQLLSAIWTHRNFLIESQSLFSVTSVMLVY